MKKIKAIGALSIGLAFLLAPGSAIRADAASDKLTVVVTDEPKSLDPCDTDLSGNSRILHNNITETLVNLEPGRRIGRPEPCHRAGASRRTDLGIQAPRRRHLP